MRGVLAGLLWICAAACGEGARLEGDATDVRSPDPTVELEVAEGEDAPDPNRPLFVEVTAAWLPPLELAIAHETYVHGGVGLIDVDADGDPDLLLPTDGQDARLLRNVGGRFQSEAGGPRGVELGTSVGAADVDRDGDIDLVLGSIRGSSLWLNDGSGAFENATEQWGLGRDTINAALVFGDFDSDGWIDLYETGYRELGGEPVSGAESRLYRNRGDRFEALAESPGAEPAATLAAAWHDFDGDGLQDLWVVRDYGLFLEPNQLFRNLGPTRAGWGFEDVAPAWGWGQRLFGMSAALADFDNDGDFDAYIGNIGANVLLVRSPEGVVDRARELGAALATFPDPEPMPDEPPLWRDYDPDAEGPIESALGRFCEDYCDPDSGAWALTSWASIFFDADQDGWQDLFVVNGFVRVSPTLPEGRGQYPVLLMNRGGRFEPAALPVIRGAGRGGAAGDIDGDGDLDLVWVTNALDGASALHVLENRASRGNWLEVQLEGVASNRDGLGAVVIVEADGMVQRRLVGADQGGYLSVGPRNAHFGLGQAETVRVEVRWPSGRVQEMEGVGGGHLSLREPE